MYGFFVPPKGDNKKELEGIWLVFFFFGNWANWGLERFLELLERGWGLLYFKAPFEKKKNQRALGRPSKLCQSRAMS